MNLASNFIQVGKRTLFMSDENLSQSFVNNLNEAGFRVMTSPFCTTVRGNDGVRCHMQQLKIQKQKELKIFYHWLKKPSTEGY